MSGYIIEEPNEIPVFYNVNDKSETIEYWRLYSPLQKKRFKKVLYQMREIWTGVYNTLRFIRNSTDISIEGSNELMLKIHKLFIIELKNKIEFYKEEKMRQRKQKDYLKKKINKIRTTTNKI